MRSVPARPRAGLGADRVAFGIEDGGNVHLYTVAADGSAQPELLAGGEQYIGLYDFVDGTLVYTASTHDRPHEVFKGDGGDGACLTSVAEDFVTGRELAEVERFTATSADGTEVDAWLVRPPGFDESKRYPTLLVIHGGPFAQYGTGFFDEVQVYAGAVPLRPLLEPARRLRPLRGVGTRDPRPERRRGQGLGLGRLRGSDGVWWTRRSRSSRSSTRTSSASSAARTAAT